MSVAAKVLKKLKSGAWYPFYNTFYEKAKVQPNTVLLESRSGKGLESNIFYLIKELNRPEYKKFRLFLAVRKDCREAVEKKLSNYKLSVTLVTTGSLNYYHRLSTAEFLVNDTSFPGRFLKKEGQTYVNVWHGTPLKKMGRDNFQERHIMGNVMRNLLMADYLVFPNTFMEEKMTGAYMLDNLYHGTVLSEGYPRNGIFFDTEAGEKTKAALGFEGKQLSLYMPTYRDVSNAVNGQAAVEEMKSRLKELDHLLTKEQVLLVKLHPFVGNLLDTAQYTHIRRFPEGYDTYDVLNACDVLITDYSSVLYDFANTGRKIILWAYDREEYAVGRGMYEDIENYPFFISKTAEETAEFLKKEGGAADEAFRKRYETYENKEAAARLCRHVFLKEKVCLEKKLTGNGRENVLIYAGDLAQNGITTALCSMLKGLDREKYNYYISFRMNSLKNEPERLARIPEDLGLYPIASEMNLDFVTAVCQMIFLKFGFEGLGIGKRLEKAYKREWKKHFGDSVFRQAIHYNGYENYMLALFMEAPCRRTVWVHNNMVEEVRTKKNPSRYLLHKAYGSYEHVAPVADHAADSVKELSGRSDNITVVPNCHDYRKVLERADAELAFDKDTTCTVSFEKLKEVLEGTDTKFINVGRFSPEKGQDRLIRAFDAYWEEHKDTWLIIIGGLGNLYEELCAQAAAAKSGDHIILIRSMSNPMPVVKNSDLFVMSSFYEGLSIVIFEADTLGLPIVATDVPGLHGFLSEYGGYLVSSSEEGLLEGMKAAYRKEVPVMNVDYEKFNQKAMEKVMKLLES